MKLRGITYAAIAFLAFAIQTTYAQAPDANPLSTGLKGSYTNQDQHRQGSRKDARGALWIQANARYAVFR